MKEIADIAINEVTSWFSNPVMLAAQIFGLIASALNCIGFIMRKKTHFLIDQTAVNSAFGIEYFLLGAYEATLNNIVNVVKMLVFYKYEKDKKRVPKIIITAFLCVSVILGLLVVLFRIDGGSIIVNSDIKWYAFIPPTTAILFTFATSEPNPLIYRPMLLVCSILWIIYDIFYKAWVSLVYTIVEAMIGLVMLIREFIKPTEYVKY